jgi:hypothetical protein
MAKLFVPDFWPFFKTTERRQFHYTDNTGVLEPIYSVFMYDAGTDSMLYVDFNKSAEWQDTWYIQYRPGFGVAEWRDDLPQKNSTLRTIFGNTIKAVYSEPIGWGEWAEIGKFYFNSPKYDPIKSWPPQWLTGSQLVNFEALHPEFTLRNGTKYSNVLQMSYIQRWNDKTGGARYYMAKGVGPIAIEWIGVVNHQIVYTSPRIDATVKSF